MAPYLDHGRIVAVTLFVACQAPRPSLPTAAGVSSPRPQDAPRSPHQYERPTPFRQLASIVAKLKHEFNRIVEYFEQAVELALFAPLKRALIFEARLLSWKAASKQNLPDPIPFRLCLSRIAEKYRRSRQKVSKQRDELIVAGVFTPLGDGSYRINKDYRLWCDPATRKPLFDAGQLAILDDIRDSRVSPKSDAPSPKGDSPVVGECNLLVHAPSPKGYTFDTPPRPSYYPPPEDRAKTEEERAVHARTRDVRDGAGTPESPKPPECASTTEQITALRLWCESRGLITDYTYWATDQAKEYPADWIKALFSAKLIGAKPVPPLSLLGSILRRFQRQGYCEYLHTNGRLPGAGPGTAPESKAQRKARELKEGFARMKASRRETLRDEEATDAPR